MKILLSLIGLALLFVLCWPLALLVLVAWPLLWLITLPFRLLGWVGLLVLSILGAILLLPARLLGLRWHAPS